MASKRHTPEQIVAKLRQVDVLTSQGTSVADAVRSIGVTEVDSGRELAAPLQRRAPARLSGLSPTRAGGVCTGVGRVAGRASGVSFAGHAPASAQASPQLTFTLDHQLGADQYPSSQARQHAGNRVEKLEVQPGGQALVGTLQRG
jgi:hypothetical protein